jgi:D-aminopeptidase
VGAHGRLLRRCCAGAEEAVLNALVANQEMIGRDGNRTPALPHDKVVAALKARGVIIG